MNCQYGEKFSFLDEAIFIQVYEYRMLEKEPDAL
jgi:hypothetical protein